ncbi:MAG TPA: nucleoside recognition protein [Clostridiales bacterium]|nr:nucleoside recognition protein [Clostridiales bacterium]
MINYLWGFMLLLGLILGFLRGETAAINQVFINSPKEAVTLCITMLGLMAMWMGIMQIATKAGIISALTKILRPFLKYLFPDIPEGHIANEYISSNIIANMLGLGWAATPMGLKAMSELQKLNPDKNIASLDMCTFIIINISSLQLIPVNMMAYRSQYLSINPAEILFPSILSTLFSTIVGILFAMIARELFSRGGK